jgi:vacuolar-type H+-ATPase subunit I/STV1
MGLIISVIASGSFIMTAFGIFGEGTCSFSGRGGARVLMVTTYSDGSGAISCNLAGILMLLAVGAYWAYILSESGYSNNSSYGNTQTYNSDLYKRPNSSTEISSPVDNFLNEKNTFSESGYKQAKAEEELVEAQEIIDNYKNKQPEEVEVDNSEIETIEIEIKELQEKKEQMLLNLEQEKKRIAEEKLKLERELQEKKEIENLKNEINNLKKEIEDLEQ